MVMQPGDGSGQIVIPTELSVQDGDGSQHIGGRAVGSIVTPVTIEPQGRREVARFTEIEYPAWLMMRLPFSGNVKLARWYSLSSRRRSKARKIVTAEVAALEESCDSRGKRPEGG